MVALSNGDIEIIKNAAKKKGLKIIFMEGENNEREWNKWTM